MRSVRGVVALRRPAHDLAAKGSRRRAARARDRRDAGRPLTSTSSQWLPHVAAMSASRIVHTEASPTPESNGYSERRGTTDHLPRWITASMRNAVDSFVASRLVLRVVHCDVAIVTAAPDNASAMTTTSQSGCGRAESSRRRYGSSWSYTTVTRSPTSSSSSLSGAVTRPTLTWSYSTCTSSPSTDTTVAGARGPARSISTSSARSSMLHHDHDDRDDEQPRGNPDEPPGERATW